jgi:hypothetical protein
MRSHRYEKSTAILITSELYNLVIVIASFDLFGNLIVALVYHICENLSRKNFFEKHIVVAVKVFRSFFDYVLKMSIFDGILIMFVYVKRKGKMKDVEFYTDHRIEGP